MMAPHIVAAILVIYGLVFIVSAERLRTMDTGQDDTGVMTVFWMLGACLAALAVLVLVMAS